MNQPFHKLLSILLIFLLASLPLKTIAVELPVDSNAPCHSIDNLKLNQTDKHCDQCDETNNCNNMSSSLSLALIQASSEFNDSSLVLSLQNYTQSKSLQTVAVLLRPPRT